MLGLLNPPGTGTGFPQGLDFPSSSWGGILRPVPCALNRETTCCPHPFHKGGAHQGLLSLTESWMGRRSAHSHLTPRSYSLQAGFSPDLRALPTFLLGISKWTGVPVAPSSAPATCPVSLGSVLSSPEVPEGWMGSWGGLAGNPRRGLEVPPLSQYPVGPQEDTAPR